MISNAKNEDNERKPVVIHLLTVMPSFAMVGITIAGAIALRSHAFDAGNGMYETKFATVSAQTCAKNAFLG